MKTLRCAKKKCRNKIRPLLDIGLCPYCQQNFCLQHRLMETHECPNLFECFKKEKEKNAKKLFNEKCISSSL